MREILVVDPGESFGGTERVVLESARRLAGAGERVSALVAPAPGATPLADALAPHCARVTRWPSVVAPDDHFHATVRLLAQKAPDIVHLHLPWPHATPWFSLAARMAGVRAVITTEHILLDERHLRDDLRKRAAAFAIDRTITVSRAIADALSARWGYRRDRITVIPNGVDLAAFPGPDAGRRDAARARLGVAGDAPLIGSFGRLEQQKGFVHLVRAFAQVAQRVPAARLAIAGEGSERDRLIAVARELGIANALILPGHQSDAAGFLAALDLFVLPSLWEGMPLSLLEAMAMGLPVIASNTPGSTEILRAGPETEIGVLTPIGDEASLAGAMAALLTAPAEAQKLARAGLAHVRAHHDAARLFERLLQVYDHLAPEHAP